MAYIPLHHKYRPQRFADVVGQSAVVQTLSNAIRSDRIAPAYLFCGPRGTGKTSSARILAKSLNCVDGPTPEPCNQCEACTSITNGSSLDVIEIDAASNTGVDNIRELIERSQFAPVNCRYKVYVLDEVHMLSTAAFNALLKTLEEPPPQVVFVLATTDPQRVLPTVISRCQRFDFRRIPLESMVDHLQVIAGKEAIEIAEPALELIAQIAQGGLRDAESLLDQLSLLPEQIEVENVWDLVGAVPERELLALLDAIDRKDAQQVITQLRHLMDNGKEPLVLLQNLTGFYRDLLLAKTAPGQRDMVALTQPTWDALIERAPHYGVADILTAQRRLIDVEPLLKNTTQPRLWLEISLLNLLQAEAIASPRTAAPAAPAPQPATSTPPAAPARPAPTPAPAPRTVTQPPAPPPERSSNPPASQPAAVPTTTPEPPPTRVEAPTASPPPTFQPSSSPAAPSQPTPAPAPSVAPAAAIASGQTVAAHWPAVLDSLPFSKSALLKQHVSVQEESQTKAILALAPKMRAFATRIRAQFEELETLISRRLGRPVKLELVLGEAKSSPPPVAAPPPSAETAPISTPPATATAPPPSTSPSSLAASSAPPPVADVQPTPVGPASNGAVTQNGAAAAPLPGRSPVDEPDVLERATSRLADFFSGSIVDDSAEDEAMELPVPNDSPQSNGSAPSAHFVPPSPPHASASAPVTIPGPVPEPQPVAAPVAATEIPIAPASPSPKNVIEVDEKEEDEYELPF